MPSPSSSRKRKEPSTPTETTRNTDSKAAKLASGLYKELPCGQLKKLCSVEGCSSNAYSSGVCCSHGAKRATCSHEGCGNQVVNSGVCITHGAKRITCSYEGCTNKAVVSGVCTVHGAKKTTCSHEGCTKQAQNSGVCRRHGAKKAVRKICTHEGCTNQAVMEGVCCSHGAKQVRRTCSHEGCTNQAQKKGVCKRHGANKFIKKRKSSAVVSDNEDDTNDNHQRRVRRRIKPSTTTTTTTEANNNGIGIGSEVNLDHAADSNNDTEETEMNEPVLEENNLQSLPPQLPQNRQAIDNGTDQSAGGIVNNNATDNLGEDNSIGYVGDDWGGDDNDIDFEQDTVTINNEQQQSSIVNRSRSMQYLLATVVVMMMCGRALYSPKNDGLSLIDDGTDDSSRSSHPSTEVSSSALSIKNQSFINHSPDATPSTAKRDDEVNGVETSDMYSNALAVYHKMSPLNHEAQVKSGVEEIKDSRSISNTTTDISTDKDRIFDKKQVDKRISITMPPPISTATDVLDDIDMVRDSKQDEILTPELKSSFPGLSLIATVCLLVISISICRRISRLATAKAKVANSNQHLYHVIAGRNRSRSLAATKIYVAINIQRRFWGIAGRNNARSLAAAKTRVANNIQRLFRGRSGRNKARLLAAKIKIAVNIQRLFRGRASRMEPPGIIWSSLEQRTTARAEGTGDDSTISTQFTWNTLSSHQSSEQTQLSKWSTEKYTRREDISRSGNGLDVHVLQTAKAVREDVIQTQELCTSELIHGQEEIKLGQKKIMEIIRGLTLVDGSKNPSEKIDSAAEVSSPRPPINLHKILAQEAQQRHKQMFGGDLS